MSHKPTRQAEVAVIGGTGLYRLDTLEEIERRRLLTRWGEPSSEIIFVRHASLSEALPVAFLARHGLEHSIPPHKINYRANLWALKQCGVKKIIAVAAVGGISQQMSPCTLVIPDQIIDYTYGRRHTFYDDSQQPVTHIDFTEPYSAQLRNQLLVSARSQSIEVVDGGVYAATQGPRLETAAEIEKLRRDGADIVGMTGMPEAALARELDIDYACCALVVNWAAGCAGTRKIEHGDMQQVVDEGMVSLKKLLSDCLQAL